MGVAGRRVKTVGSENQMGMEKHGESVADQGVRHGVKRHRRLVQHRKRALQIGETGGLREPSKRVEHQRLGLGVVNGLGEVSELGMVSGELGVRSGLAGQMAHRKMGLAG